MTITAKELQSIDDAIGKCATLVHRKTSIEYEDARQELILHIIKELQKFEPTDQFPVKPFLYSALHYGYLRLVDRILRRQETQKKHYKTVKQVYGENVYPFEDEILNKLTVQEYMAKLSPVMQDAFKLKADKIPNKIITRLLHISESHMYKQFRLAKY